MSSATTGEQGHTTTALVAVRATGYYVPPMLIFKRKRTKPALLDYAPVGTIGGCSDSGLIDKNIIFQIFSAFGEWNQLLFRKKGLPYARWPSIPH